MHERLLALTSILWSALGLYWLVSARDTKRRVRRQSSLSRLATLAVTAAGFALLFSTRARIAPLGQRVTPAGDALEIAGVAITFTGVAFAMWSRYRLGRNWSATPMIKDHHELVRSGPYHLVRHPIYAGAILACFGTALVVGELGAFAGAALTTVAWAIKMRTEEALLTSEFGEAYVEYKRQVKAIIPFVI